MLTAKFSTQKSALLKILDDITAPSLFTVNGQYHPDICPQHLIQTLIMMTNEYFDGSVHSASSSCAAQAASCFEIQLMLHC